ncbi:hypothetical protein DFJ43DRAFT_1090166 [Lentinula guzmanii]|uniref:Uncharacterized protein n=1 Tax=Lentinula guzmanii TaxID=2804957 RepID=A0AA38JEV0_9AGAR|nr:hypothetical protein DFJ43DRAFT_1090166 [Lentinula guzmanii]
MYPGSLKGLRFKAFLIIIVGLVSVTYAAAVPLSSPNSMMARGSRPYTGAAHSEQGTMEVNFDGQDGEIVAEELMPTLEETIRQTVRKLANDLKISVKVKISGNCVVAHGSIPFTLTHGNYDRGQILFLQRSKDYQIWLYSSYVDEGIPARHEKFTVPNNFVQFIPKFDNTKVAGENPKLPSRQSSSGLK